MWQHEISILMNSFKHHDSVSVYLLSPIARYSRTTVWSEGRCCTRTRSSLLKSQCPPQLVRLFFTCCLWSSSANVDVPFCPLWAVFPWCYRQMRPHVEPPPAHQLYSPGSMVTSPAPRSTRDLCLSLSRSVSANLSLYVFILAFPVKALSLIVLILSAFIGHVTLSLLHAMPTLHILDSLPWTSISGRQKRGIFLGSTSGALSTTILGGSRSFCQLWLSSSTSILEPQSATEHHTHLFSSSIPNNHSVSVLSKILPRTTPFWYLVMHKTATVRSWWQFLESCDMQKKLTPSSPIFTEPNFPLQFFF